MDLPDFFAALIVAVSMYYFEDVDPARKPPNTPQSEILDAYDFVIIGAGTAGCVLASRLTEVVHWKVLLIEAGEDENALTDAPAIAFNLQGTRFDWNYTTVEQEYVCRDTNGICSFPRGHVMGGSSTINLMLYSRGNKEDFDEWEQQTNPGWSYKDILKYFVKLETLVIPSRVNNETKEDLSTRGFFGPVTVGRSRYFYRTAEAALSAAIESGQVQGDFNGVNQERVDYIQSTVNGPSRESASKAYLNPIRQRKNLNIIKSSTVSKILFKDSSSVQAVEYIRDGITYVVEATKEIILSAGVINTPKILLLSGIGPAEDINPLNIPAIKELPVGRNLQDHPLVRILITTNHTAQDTETDFYTNETILDYAKHRQGPLTYALSQIITYKSYLNSTTPNGQWFSGGMVSSNNQTDIIHFGLTIIKPKSRGSVKLSSSDPKDPPLINPAYLTDPDDMTLLKVVIRDVINLLQMPAFQKIDARITPDENPLCASTITTSNESAIIDCLIANQSSSYYHGVGTARMGPATDTNSVVNANLTVHGVSNLRVIDASIMPNITRGNTNAPTFMIAEKGADLIKTMYGEPVSSVVPVEWTVAIIEELLLNKLNDEIRVDHVTSNTSVNYL